MNKKLLLLLCLISTLIKAQQDADLFVELHNVPSTEIPANITNATSGDLLYNTTDQNVYVFDGTGWKAIGTGSSTDLSFDMNTGSLTLTSPETAGNEVDLHSYVRIAPVKEITGDYTLLESDTGHVINVNSATEINITVPSTLPLGFNVSMYQTNSGKFTIISDGTSTIKSRYSRFSSNGTNAAVGLVCLAASDFYLTGYLR